MKSKKRKTEYNFVWYNLDTRYSRYSGPTIIWPDGDIMWFDKGVMHALYCRSAFWMENTGEWYLNNKDINMFNSLDCCFDI